MAEDKEVGMGEGRVGGHGGGQGGGQGGGWTT